MNNEEIFDFAYIYQKRKDLEREFESVNRIFENMADKYMPYLQAHHINHGRKWGKDEDYHLGCLDCQIKAAKIAVELLVIN